MFADPGASHFREVVHPVYIDLKAVRNTAEKPQTITFAPIGGVQRGTASVPLRATSDAGLPVSFFVVTGPAVVRENTLVFTKIPQRSKWPVNVTAAAWQWGRRENPAVKMAEIVQQTFRLTAPSP